MAICWNYTLRSVWNSNQTTEESEWQQSNDSWYENKYGCYSIKNIHDTHFYYRQKWSCRYLCINCVCELQLSKGIINKQNAGSKDEGNFDDNESM